MDIVLEGSTNGPVYLQIKQQIESRIHDKKLKSGEELPSPNALAQKLAVDKGEVQRAYFELEHAGLVLKKTSKDFLGKTKIRYVVK